MKSFVRYFLFGLLATSIPAAVCILFAGIVFGTSRYRTVTVAILCVQVVYSCIRYSRRSRGEKSKSLSAEAASAGESRARIYWGITGCLAGVVCVTFLFFAAVCRIIEVPWEGGAFDRVKMEDLVAQVRNQEFSATAKFYWSDASGAPVLSSAAGAGDRKLWAERAEAKNLKLIIWTKKGEDNSLIYGFAYSDVPLTSDGTPKDAPTFFTSGPESVIAHPATSAFDVADLHLMKRIDAHWWMVYEDPKGQGD